MRVQVRDERPSVIAVARLHHELDFRALHRSGAEDALVLHLDDVAARLADQRRLRAQVTPERAADVLWVLTGFWTFDELFSGRGLDADGCADILIDMARSTLLADDPGPRPGS